MNTLPRLTYKEVTLELSRSLFARWRSFLGAYGRFLDRFFLDDFSHDLTPLLLSTYRWLSATFSES